MIVLTTGLAVFVGIALGLAGGLPRPIAVGTTR
jgi:hypothetical protein